MPVSRIIKYVFDFRYKMSKDKSSRRTCVKTVSKALSGNSEGSIFNTWTSANNSALEIVWWNITVRCIRQRWFA